VADERAEEPSPHTGTDIEQLEVQAPTPLEPRDATPSVLVAIVAHDPGEWFEQTLDSIATQDYPRLHVMVIDGVGDAQLKQRVSNVIPRATVLDASDTVGFGAAANAVLDTEADSAFLLVCHDDVALDPDAVRVMVTESLRSNAGVVGPKLVEWDHPDRLQHVGLIVDRFGVVAEAIEPSELDQEQYDFVADFSAVPTACMLIRADLFSQLGGFDEKISFRGDDVDLCWRAQLAGSRVIVAPDARVRHIEDLIPRTGVDDVRRTRARHQLRTVLTVTSLPSLVATFPLQILLTMIEAAAAVVTGSLGQVRDVVGAYTWNLRQAGDIVRRRRALRRDRQKRFADVKQLQHRGSVRIAAFVRGQIGRNRGGIGTASRGLAASMRQGTTRAVALVAAGVVAYVLFGSRSLITDGVPAIGDFNSFPAQSGDLISQWWNGWRDRDLGSPGTLPSGVAILAVGSWLLSGSLGLVRTIWVIGPLFVGLIGAWRMTGWMGLEAGSGGSPAGIRGGPPSVGSDGGRISHDHLCLLGRPMAARWTAPSIRRGSTGIGLGSERPHSWAGCGCGCGFRVGAHVRADNCCGTGNRCRRNAPRWCRIGHCGRHRTVGPGRIGRGPGGSGLVATAGTGPSGSRTNMGDNRRWSKWGLVDDGAQRGSEILDRAGRIQSTHMAHGRAHGGADLDRPIVAVRESRAGLDDLSCWLGRRVLVGQRIAAVRVA